MSSMLTMYQWKISKLNMYTKQSIWGCNDAQLIKLKADIYI